MYTLEQHGILGPQEAQHKTLVMPKQDNRILRYLKQHFIAQRLLSK